jgi:ribose/xylose/arabinose/galactoside ABC-type transport system permease subunit
MKSRERSYVPFIVAALVTFIVGLAIGAWQGNDETVLNKVSALLLTVGVLAFVTTVVIEVLRRRKLAP